MHVSMMAPWRVERLFAYRTDMDKHELERLRRSIVMISPGQLALRREEAILLLEDLAAVQERLDSLRTELRRLAEA
jgi:hypothetical protein